MAKPIKPGTDNKPAGTYIERGPRGGNVQNPRVVHIGRGDLLKNRVMVGNVKNSSILAISISSTDCYFFLLIQKFFPKMSICIHASAYNFLFSSYLVM